MPDRSVVYVLKGYPRRSELFIAGEIWRLEQLGVRIHLVVLTPPDEDDHHAVVEQVDARPWYLPPTTSLSATTARAWLRANSAPYRPALARVVRRHPVRAVRARGGGAGAVVPGPRRLAPAQGVPEGAAPGRGRGRSRRSPRRRRPPPRPLRPRLHDGDVAGRSADRARPSRSPATPRTSTAPSLNPAGLLARKLRGGRVRRDVHRRQRRAPPPPGRPDARPPRVPRPQPGLRPSRRGGALRADRRHRLPRRQRRADWSRRRASTCSSRPWRSLHRRGIDITLTIAGEDGPARADIAAAVARHGLHDRVARARTARPARPAGAAAGGRRVRTGLSHRRRR